MRQPVRAYTFRTDRSSGAAAAGRDYAMFAIDGSDLRRIEKDCDAAAADLAFEFKKGIGELGIMVRDEARRIAPGITRSTRIPKTIRSRQSGVTVRVFAGGPAAPQAGLFERGSKRNPNKIRWPLFGDTDTWYEMATRPFLQPAFERVQPRMTAFVDDIVRRAVESKSVFS